MRAVSMAMFRWSPVIIFTCIAGRLLDGWIHGSGRSQPKAFQGFPSSMFE